MVPIGIAVADRAEVAKPAVLAEPSPTAELVGQGERVIEGMDKAGRHLDASIQLAQKDDDQLLLTCLSEKRDEMSSLRGKAVAQFRALSAAVSVESARSPYVVMTVIAQKTNLVLEEASRCVGGDQGEPGSSVAAIEPPTDPDLYLPTDEAAFGQTGQAASMPIVVPPPLTLGTTDNAATDDNMPIDMPAMPNVASPMR